MKTRILLTTLGVAALAAITFNVNASDAMLSPRAAGNQIKTAPAVSTVSVAPAISLTSPRALGNQTITVASVANDVNPALGCAKTMNGTPKTIQACVQQTTMPGCARTVAAAN